MRRAKGTGTISRVPADDTLPLRFWQAALELPPSPEGKRQRQVFRCKDRAVALRALELAIHTRDSAIRRPKVPALLVTPPLVPSGSTGEWLRYWLVEIAGREVKPRTAANYQSTVRNHLLPQVGQVPLVELSAADVRGVTSAVLDKGLSSTTALHAYRVLAIALAAAHREGHTYRDAAKQVRPPRKTRPDLAVLTAAHARTIIDASRSDRLGSRWAAALLTGARQGELLGLELDRVGDSLDLSWQLQRLTWTHGCGGRCGWNRGADCPDKRVVAPAGFESRHLTGGLWLTRPKSAAGWRQVPLVGSLRVAFEARRELAMTEANPHGLMWTASGVTGAPIDPSVDNRAWKISLRGLQVPQARLHDARHAAVTLFYEAGVPEVLAMDIVGHSTTAMTRAYRSTGETARLGQALMSLQALVEGAGDD
ncbi:tyrosine-type recombinase/integrase [Frigoribacterium sp. MEB024]|uniref:tyrosine-type recombinase/integrase n=1 Tax=Frigoribacterium sp. MEB024 TaxID=1589899 RepID=UPI0018CC9A97